MRHNTTRPLGAPPSAPPPPAPIVPDISGTPICPGCTCVVTPSNASVQPWGPEGRTMHVECFAEFRAEEERDADREREMYDAMGDCEYAHLLPGTEMAVSL